ncbi:30947_t:CDS:2, partial [Racocetra persica]
MSKRSSSIIENNDPEIEVIIVNTVKPVEKRKPNKTMSIEEQELLRKIDIRIIPLFSALCILSFIDKLNIGNAKLEHIEEDLELTPTQYNWLLSAFFVAYVLFEVPSNVMLMNTKPSIWISSIMLACGIIMIFTAAAKDFPQIMILRFLLGMFEAGFFPGVIFYITKWYKNSEENYRISLFCSAATIAGAFSGLMSFSVATFLNKINGLSGWQWILIIDGVFKCTIALFSYYLIPDSAETASWLTKEEQKLAVERLNDEPSHAHESYSEIHQILDAFKDW